MIIKTHMTPEGRVVVALCDKKLLGTKIEENGLQLDLTSNFYNGKDISEKEVLLIINESHILNIVGPKTVKFALKNKLINAGNVLKIKQVPYAQALIDRGE